MPPCSPLATEFSHFWELSNVMRVDRQAGHLGALQGHDLPAEDRGVAVLAGLYRQPPVDMFWAISMKCTARRAASEPLVVGHAVGLAEGDRGQPVGIHAELVVAGAAEETAVAGLVLGEPEDPPAHRVVVVAAGPMRLAVPRKASTAMAVAPTSSTISPGEPHGTPMHRRLCWRLQEPLRLWCRKSQFRAAATARSLAGVGPPMRL